MSFHWGFLPRLDQFRPRIEAEASRALGVRVTLGEIRVRSGGWVPAFEVDDVRLHDAQGREALHLARVTAALAPRSLLVLEPRFAQLHVDGVQLDVRRERGGRLRIAGFDVGAGDAALDDGAAADWFFKQQEFVLKNGTLRWTDETRDAGPLLLTAVDLVVRNGLRRHQLRLDATPPEGWGQRFTLRGRFTQGLLDRAGDWRRWTGSAYAELPQVKLDELRRHLELPFELTSGEGTLRTWVDVARGSVSGATADLALQQVTLKLHPTLAPLALARLSGRIEGSRSSSGVQFAARDLAFATAEGLAWPASQFEIALDRREGGPVTGGRVKADRLDLGALATIAAHVPLGQAMGSMLAALAPKGLVQGLDGRWNGALDAPERYDLRATLAGLSLAAGSGGLVDGAPDYGRPGLSNAQLQLHAHERGGTARLAIDDGAIEFPGVFEQPRVAIARLATDLAWTIDAGAVTLKVRGARFANADAEGELDATWRSGAGEGHGQGRRYPGLMEMSGRLVQGDAKSVARYLPLAVPAETRTYVRDAVRGGRIVPASFSVKGDLWDFPFADRKRGEFRVAGKVQDAEFAFVPGPDWPAFTQLAGELVFEGGAMRIRDASAQISGYEVRAVNGGIADLVQQPVLELEGMGRGPAGALVRFVNATPIGGWIDGALKEASAGGASELKLALALPLADLDRSTVRGSVQLLGGPVRLTAATPLLDGARARVDFTRRGFTVAGGSARVFGGEATFEGGSQPDGTLRFNGQGVALADALKRDVAGLGDLGSRLRGQAAYRVQLGFVRGQPELNVTSNLVGLALDLPAPFAKPAETAWPLRWQNQIAADAPRDTLRIELGPVLQARFVRDLEGDAPRVLRGGIGVQDEPPSPASGVQAALRVPTLDLDAWRALAAGFGAGTGAAGGYLPQALQLRSERLLVGQRPITNVTLAASRELLPGGETLWNARLDSDQASGVIDARHAAESWSKVSARFARLALPPAESSVVETLIESPPETVPALDIAIDQFEWRGRKLGRVELEAVNRGGPARRWELTRLAATVPEASLRATGGWSPGTKRSTLDFTLELADSGAFVERLGAGRSVKGGKGRITGQLEWAGSPLAPELASLEGQLTLALDQGQLLNAEPGAARLLGVMSLQALPRRLLLDFRDVVQEGFAFDRVNGELQVARGQATTNNLRIVGVQAAVLMEGRFDLQRETQDLRVLVVPEINAGTASLAYAAINPAVGLGTFLAQLLLRRPLSLAGTREYQVSGPWAEPKVERVERRAEAPAAGGTQ